MSADLVRPAAAAVGWREDEDVAPRVRSPGQSGRLSLITINSEIISTFKDFDVIISSAKRSHNLCVY